MLHFAHRPLPSPLLSPLLSPHSISASGFFGDTPLLPPPPSAHHLQFQSPPSHPLRQPPPPPPPSTTTPPTTPSTNNNNDDAATHHCPAATTATLPRPRPPLHTVKRCWTRRKVPLFDPTLSRARLVPAKCGSHAAKLTCGRAGDCSDYTCAASICGCQRVNTTTEELYQANYGIGEAQGALYTDVLGMPHSKGYKKMAVVFGCDSQAADMFDSSNGALIGINYQPASLYSQVPTEHITSAHTTPFCLQPLST
ncbi:MAG: hypothetical protein WDW36_007128 [Sanguina aurantia]